MGRDGTSVVSQVVLSSFRYCDNFRYEIISVVCLAAPTVKVLWCECDRCNGRRDLDRDPSIGINNADLYQKKSWHGMYMYILARLYLKKLTEIRNVDHCRGHELEY